MTSPSSASRYDLRATWWSLLLVVPCFSLSFAIGEGIISLLGYEVGGSVTPPFWAAAVATVPAVLAFALPTIPTWHFASRARREGAHHALLPFGITVVLICAFLLLSTFLLHH